MKPRHKLHRAFAELTTKGYVAPQQAWQCCQSCGCAALPENTTKYIFYHQQDFTNWKNGGGMYLAWDGNSIEIIEALKKQGLTVTHNDPRHRIHVK